MIARKYTPVAKPSQKATASPAPTHAGKVTKQERVLALLRQSGGASLDDIVDVTDWRIHSIRGFLAGTVKKKLGYALSSARGADNVLRYKIPARPAVR